MNTTKILGEAIGIQSQGTIDKTETQTNVGLTGAVIVGQFLRGRLDQPMAIHQGNIRGQLGYDPQNPFYNAVQDCLDTGVPSVQVLRVGNTNSSNICSQVDHYVYRIYDLGGIGQLPLAEYNSFVSSIKITEPNGVLIPANQYNVYLNESQIARLEFNDGALPDLGFIFCSNRPVSVLPTPM
ncbi:hypothetical protein [Acinetobacter sp. NRRL B-65365]|uniref:hypothetical protein n=1 Tax=Acinetobacter sp. NRRL B-65365 TaxID=1785092 RepID=UPI000B29240E|nr:hypothetical protein [Acinetobacter sp. NRRL B-65365]